MTRRSADLFLLLLALLGCLPFPASGLFRLRGGSLTRRSRPFHAGGASVLPGAYGSKGGQPLDGDAMPNHVYSSPPYGRGGLGWGIVRPPIRSAAQPLYYNPEDPTDGAFNASMQHFAFSDGKWVPRPSNPLQGAAYLPRERTHTPDPMHPAFGYVPVNYVAPDVDARVFQMSQPLGAQLHQPFSGSAFTQGALVPTQIPFPISMGGNHPLYAQKYFPGVRPGFTPLAFPTPLHSRYKIAKPSWFDAPGSWPRPFVERVPTVPDAPPPPPGGEAGAEAAMF